MIIIDVKYSHHLLNFTKPFQTKNGSLTKREILLIELISEDGKRSIGEAAPLHDLSYESISECRAIIESIINNHLPLEINDDNKFSFLRKFNKNIPVSLQFAFEQAVLNLLRKPNPPDNSLKEENKIINVNAVIGFGDNNSIAELVKNKIELGYKTIKLKVGRQNFNDDLELVRIIRERFGNNFELRLDANSAWDYQNSVYNLKQFENFNIQYIEQPCADIEELINLSKNSSVPVALDESIKSITQCAELIEGSPIQFFVIKPSIIGAFSGILELIKKAEANNKKIIISSAFESVIGKSGLVYLASQVSHNLAHGLDTSGFFENDLGKDEFPVIDGKIDFSANIYQVYP